MIDPDEQWEWAHRIWHTKYDESDTGFGIAGVDPVWYADCQTERECGFVRRVVSTFDGERYDYKITDFNKFSHAFMRQGHEDEV